MVDQQVVDAPYDAQSATVTELVLRLRPAIDLSREQFFQFCQLNRDVTIERTAEGDIAIMAPAGWETSMRNARLIAALYLWAEEDGSGVVCDSSAGFELPNGAVRSPDVGWVARSRLARIPREQKRRFLPLCPDFVIELCSPSDSVPALRPYRGRGIAGLRIAAYRRLGVLTRRVAGPLGPCAGRVAQEVDTHELASTLHVMPRRDRRHHLDRKPGFLGDLTAQRLDRRLSERNPPAGQLPLQRIHLPPRCSPPISPSRGARVYSAP